MEKLCHVLIGNRDSNIENFTRLDVLYKTKKEDFESIDLEGMREYEVQKKHWWDKENQEHIEKNWKRFYNKGEMEHKVQDTFWSKIKGACAQNKDVVVLLPEPDTLEIVRISTLYRSDGYEIIGYIDKTISREKGNIENFSKYFDGVIYDL